MGRIHFGRVARACAATALAAATMVGIAGSPAGAVGGSIDGTVSYGGGTLPAGTVQVLACSGTSWFVGCGGPTAPVLGDGSYTIPVADGDWTVRVRTVQGLALGAQATVNVASAPFTQNLTVAAAVVNGRVQHPTDGSAYPVGHASLVLCPNGTAGAATQLGCSFSGGVDAPTDVNGNRSIVVPPGRWYAGGIASASVLGTNAFAQGIGSPAVDLAVLVDGQDVNPVFNVAAAFVDGAVRDAYTSAPLSGRSVSVCPAVGVCFPAPAPSVTSGGSGQFSMLLPPGAFVLTTAGQGGALATASTTVVDAADQNGVDLAIGGGSISGSWQLADGSPYNIAGNVAVSLCNGGSACIPVFLSIPFPGSSTLSIANVPAGTYDIFSGAPNTSAMAHLVDAPVTVVDGQLSGGEILRLGGGSIDVTVTNGGLPVAGASARACLQAPLAASGEFCSGQPLGGTDANGHITLGALPPGTYTVRAALGSTLSGSASGITVSDNNVSTASVPLAQTGITGAVTGNTGTGAIVWACAGTTDPNPGWGGFGTPCTAGGSQANVVAGSYTINGLTPGPYRVRVYALVNNAVVFSPAVAATAISGTTTIVNLELPGGNSGSVPTGGGTVTLASPAGTSLTDITATAVPTSPAPPAGLTFPVGLVGFKVTGLANGAAADVTMTFPTGTNPTGYAKYHDGVWEDFTSHVTIAGDTVTLHLVDGGAGDDDDTANGVIVDPGAPFVGYSFTGFRAPVDNAAVNSAKAGQAIPVKWTITSAAGTPVADPASVVSVRSSGAACTGGTADDIEAYTTGASGLQYQGNGNWQFNWKTEKAWAGQCRTLTVKLADGSSHIAAFKFK